MKRQVMTLAVAATLLSACATTDDPREGGFIGGVQGLSSGAYERRIAERESNLATLRAMQADLAREGETLDAQKRERQQALQQERDRLAALDQDVQALQRRLAELEDTKDADAGRVAAMHKRIDDLKEKLGKQARSIDALEGGGSAADALEGSGSGDLSDSRRQQLEAQHAALQKEYEELLNLTLMLAQ